MTEVPPGYEHLLVSINWPGIQYSDEPTGEFRAHCEQLRSIPEVARPRSWKRH